MQPDLFEIEPIASFDPQAWKPDAVAVSSSAGIDSVASLGFVASLDWGDARLVVIHSDLGDMEHRAAHPGEAAPGSSPLAPGDLARAQADYYGFEYLECRRGNGNLLDQAEAKGIWMLVKGVNKCQGTSDHKRGPIWTVYTAIAKQWHDAHPFTDRPCRILEVMGLAAHESNPRRDRLDKMEATTLGGKYRVSPAGNKTVRKVMEWQPLADWTSAEIKAFAASEIAKGAPGLHWVYAAGMPRLSCAICPFANRRAIEIAGALNPELLERFVQVEKKIGPWPNRFTLAEVQADILAGRTSNEPADWGNQA